MSNSPQRQREIIESVELLGVRLLEVTAIASAPQGKLRKMPVDVGHSARVIDKTAQGFDIAAEITVRAGATGRPQRGAGSRRDPAILSIRATFELHYHLPKISEFSRQDLMQFANVNGVYNA